MKILINLKIKHSFNSACLGKIIIEIFIQLKD